MRLTSFFIILFILSSIFISNCSKKRIDKELFTIIESNLKAAQEENIEAYMKTLHEDSPAYTNTEPMMLKVFNNYDLKYKIDELKVIKKNDTEAEVEFIQTTTKISGPVFRNNRIKGVHVLKKSGNEWKIFSTILKDIKYLEE